MKTLITALTIFIGGSYISQSYIPLPASSTAKWNSYYTYLDNSFQTQTDWHNYYADGDSIIAGKTYQRILKKVDLSLGGYDQKYIYLYNDTINKKVYILETGSDELLYDFNLTVGDTLKGIYLSVADSRVVIKIDYVVINGRNHKRFITDTTATGEPVQWIIEGIGAPDLIEGLNAFERTTEFICYSENNQVVFGDTNCTFTVSIDESLLDVNFNLYPNPVSNKLNLSISEGKVEQIKLINNQGQTVKIFNETLLSSVQLEVSDLSKGTYFIEVKTGEGIGNKMFIKN